MLRTRLPLPPRLAVLLVAFVATSLVWSGGTFSSFNRTSSMPGNSVRAGTVVISDNDAGTALLSASGLMPGASTTTCLRVTYSGNAASTVRLYGTIGGTGLATYLTLTVTRGTFSGTPGAGSCTGFTADSGGGVLYNSTLGSFPTTTGTAINDPAASWTNGDSRGYKLTLTLPSGVASAAQGKTATADFIWLAVNS